MAHALLECGRLDLRQRTIDGTVMPEARRGCRVEDMHVAVPAAFTHAFGPITHA